MIPQNHPGRRSVIQQLLKLQGEYVCVKKNEILFREQDNADSFYLVLDGSVELLFHTGSVRTFSRKILKNEFFGFDELFGTGKRINSAIASEDTELLKISAADTEPSTKHNPPLPLKEKLLALTSHSKLDSNSLNISESADVKIITCSFPRANLSNALAFRNFIFDIINRGNKKIIIDLTACKIIDSTFLGSLIVILKRISSIGGKLRLVCSADFSSWLLVMANMDKVFELCGTVDEALISINK